jgi:DNA-nicking Smr family endonuclease
MKLDLHGYTVHNAWIIFKDHITNCYLDGHKTTVVVTGYGKMANEIETWCSYQDHIISCERLDPNQGAFRIKIKKKPVSKITQPTSNMSNSLSALQKKFQK